MLRGHDFVWDDYLQDAFSIKTMVSFKRYFTQQFVYTVS